MKVKDLLVYFNTTGTEAGTDMKWLDQCLAAGGPEETICVSLLLLMLLISSFEPSGGRRC